MTLHYNERLARYETRLRLVHFDEHFQQSLRLRFCGVTKHFHGSDEQMHNGFVQFFKYLIRIAIKKFVTEE